MPAPDGVMAMCGARRSTSGRKTRALSSGEPTASRTQAQEAERVLKKSHQLMQAPQRLQQEDFSSTIDRDLNLSRGLGRPFGQAARCTTTIGPRLRRVRKKGRAACSSTRASIPTIHTRLQPCSSGLAHQIPPQTTEPRLGIMFHGCSCLAAPEPGARRRSGRVASFSH